MYQNNLFPIKCLKLLTISYLLSMVVNIVPISSMQTGDLKMPLIFDLKI